MVPESGRDGREEQQVAADQDQTDKDLPNDLRVKISAKELQVKINWHSGMMARTLYKVWPRVLLSKVMSLNPM